MGKLLNENSDAICIHKGIVLIIVFVAVLLLGITVSRTNQSSSSKAAIVKMNRQSVSSNNLPTPTIGSPVNKTIYGWNDIKCYELSTTGNKEVTDPQIIVQNCCTNELITGLPRLGNICDNLKSKIQPTVSSTNNSPVGTSINRGPCIQINCVSGYSGTFWMAQNSIYAPSPKNYASENDCIKQINGYSSNIDAHLCKPKERSSVCNASTNMYETDYNYSRDKSFRCGGYQDTMWCPLDQVPAEKNRDCSGPRLICLELDRCKSEQGRMTLGGNDQGHINVVVQNNFGFSFASTNVPVQYKVTMKRIAGGAEKVITIDNPYYDSTTTFDQLPLGEYSISASEVNLCSYNGKKYKAFPMNKTILQGLNESVQLAYEESDCSI